MMHENEIATKVIGYAIEVHKSLGPGLLESAYHACLIREMELNGLWYESESPIALKYKDIIVTDAYRMDLLVEGKVVVELKAVDKVSERHKAQLLTYLRLSNCRLGLLMNFHELNLKNGIRRVVNQL